MGKGSTSRLINEATGLETSSYLHEYKERSIKIKAVRFASKVCVCALILLSLSALTINGCHEGNYCTGENIFLLNAFYN